MNGANNFLVNQIMKDIENGNLEGVRSGINKNGVNLKNEDGKTLVHQCVIHNKRNILIMLLENKVELDFADKLGNTALHAACDMGKKDMVLFLLMSKSDYTLKNNEEKLPGEDDPDVAIFIGNIVDEEKCFQILNPEQVKKLTNIFNDIDYDRSGRITLSKAASFNHFVDSNVSKTALARDAEDFIGECAVINAEDVCLDEWLFSFSKLYYCDKKTFNKFITDYDNAVNRAGGRLSEIMAAKDEEI